MDYSVEGEYHHSVTWLYFCITAHEMAFAVTDESGYGHVVGEMEVLDGCTGDF